MWNTMVDKLRKVFGQLLWLLLFDLLHKCNNTKICFSNKEIIRFNYIILVVYNVSVETIWRTLFKNIEPIYPQNIRIVNPYAHKIITNIYNTHSLVWMLFVPTFTCRDQHVHNIFAPLNSHANKTFKSLYQQVQENFGLFLLHIFYSQLHH